VIALGRNRFGWQYTHHLSTMCEMAPRMLKVSVGDDQFVRGGEVNQSVAVMASIAFRKVTENVSSCVVTLSCAGVPISGNQ